MRSTTREAVLGPASALKGWDCRLSEAPRGSSRPTSAHIQCILDEWISASVTRSSFRNRTAYSQALWPHRGGRGRELSPGSPVPAGGAVRPWRIGPGTVEHGQVVEACGHIGVVGAEGFLEDFQGALAERLVDGGPAGPPVQARAGGANRGATWCQHLSPARARRCRARPAAFWRKPCPRGLRADAAAFSKKSAYARFFSANSQFNSLSMTASTYAGRLFW